jgi:hypothetical protein
MALPVVPSFKVTVTDTVGNPLESRHSKPEIEAIAERFLEDEDMRRFL